MKKDSTIFYFIKWFKDNVKLPLEFSIENDYETIITVEGDKYLILDESEVSDKIDDYYNELAKNIIIDEVPPYLTQYVCVEDYANDLIKEFDNSYNSAGLILSIDGREIEFYDEDTDTYYFAYKIDYI